MLSKIKRERLVKIIVRTFKKKLKKLETKYVCRQLCKQQAVSTSSTRLTISFSLQFPRSYTSRPTVICIFPVLICLKQKMSALE